MATENAEHALTPSGYITHHLSFNTKPIGDGSFWVLNYDSFVMSVLLGVVVMGIYPEPWIRSALDAAKGLF